MNSESLKRSEESGPGESSLTMSKRTALKLRIQQFFAQLTQGCGRQHCPNENCASNSTVKQLSCDEAAVQAMHLASSKAELCSENHRSKIARTDASDSIVIRMNINDKKGISSADSSTQTILPEQVEPNSANQVTDLATPMPTMDIQITQPELSLNKADSQKGEPYGVKQADMQPTNVTVPEVSLSNRNEEVNKPDQNDDIDMLSMDIGSPNSFITTNIGGFSDSIKQLPDNLRSDSLPSSSNTQQVKPDSENPNDDIDMLSMNIGSPGSFITTNIGGFSDSIKELPNNNESGSLPSSSSTQQVKPDSENPNEDIDMLSMNIGSPNSFITTNIGGFSDSIKQLPDNIGSDSLPSSSNTQQVKADSENPNDDIDMLSMNIGSPGSFITTNIGGFSDSITELPDNNGSDSLPSSSNTQQVKPDSENPNDDIDMLSMNIGSPGSFITTNIGGFSDSIKQLPDNTDVIPKSLSPPANGESSSSKHLSLNVEQSLNSKLGKITMSKLKQRTVAHLPTSYKCNPDYSALWKYCTTKQKIHENGYLPELKQAISNIFSNSRLLNSFALKTDLREDIAQGTETDKQWDSSAKMSVGSSDVFSPKDLLSMAEINFADDLLDILEDQSKEDTVVEKEPASEKSVSEKPEPQTVPYLPTVDVVFFRTLFARISEDAVLETVLHESLVKLVNLAEKAICTNPNEYKSDPNYLNMVVILLECPLLQSPESLEEMFPKFLKIVAKLPLAANVALAHHWSRYDGAQLKNVIETIQQLIAYQVAMHYLDQTDLVAHEDQRIIDASKCLNILFFASILGGEVDRTVDEKGAAESQSMRNAPREEEAEFHLGLMDVSDNEFEFQWSAQLGTELKLTKLDSVAPLVPRVEFVNEALNDVIKIDKDYANYRVSQQGSNKFSFLHYQFLLTTLNKTTYLFYDNRVRMYSERRRTLMSSLFAGSAINPFLKIQVRRTHIINDTLVQLEMAAEDLKNLRKQLYVEFDGEEGADEGGVSKEFFALMVEEIFNPANGTFILVEESQLFWFNPQSFEGLMQYKLIGIILGLAIYNNCILEIKFPSFVYKKLLGRKARFRDIKDLHPVIYQSLCSLLEYTGDVEEDLMLTFQVEHQDVFGCTHHHDLKEGGVNIPVTKLNRQEYVDMYSDWLLNTSIEEQFNAFLGGFELVLSQSPLKYLFEASELELLLCGSEHYDFNALEESAEYDGGFTKDSQTVKDFWSVLHELSDEEKKTLLQFSTGSDRAPVGGLAKLKMILAKNGPDSDRLPTAHTCFNVILLPDYKNKKKLRELLLKAIKYSKGFGML